MKRRRLSVFPAEPLHRLGLLIAFVLIVASTEFNSTHPFLTAGLVFTFAMGYLFASVTTRRAGFLYGAMLFSAVAFFLASYGLGAPVTSFPLLSVALVIFLLVLGHRLSRLPEALAEFPLTVFRVMNMTVAVFSVWALTQVGDLMARGGLIRHVAAMTFLGYAGVYLVHRMLGQRALYSYLFSLFLMLGTMFLAGALWSIDLCWAGALATAAAILMLGTGLHQERGYDWSRHFYFCSVPILTVSLLGSLGQWPLALINLSLTSLVLWVSYERLDRAVEGAAGAAMAERVIAKCLHFGAVGLVAPIVPLMFLQPANPRVALAGLISGITFSLIGKQRRAQVEMGGGYVLAAVMLVSAGLLGLGRQLQGISGILWALAAPQAILGCLGMLCLHLKKTQDQMNSRRIAVSAIFPAFFAWFFLVMNGQLGIAILVALLVSIFVAYLSVTLKERLYTYALGPSLTGVFIAAVRLPGDRLVAWITGAAETVSNGVISVWQGMIPWGACTAAAVVTGFLFVWATGRKRQSLRGASNLGWLILSVAAIVMAWSEGASALLYCATAVGVTAILTAWWRRYEQPDVLQKCAHALAWLSTVLVLVMAAWSSMLALRLSIVGACLLLFSAAYWTVWWLQEDRGPARLANGLFALGALLVIAGLFPGVQTRLAVGGLLVLCMFLLAAVASRRFADMASSAEVTGHCTSIVLAVGALVGAWAAETPRLYLCAIPLALYYAVIPGLRQSVQMRLGVALWTSVAILFGISAKTGTPYEQQIHLMIGLSMVWVILGYVLNRFSTEAWSMPLYSAAALVASFCCVVGILAPVTDTSWLVFLTSGVVFVSLFLIVRDDIFIYLLSVALALMGYDWLRGTSSIFTADIYFWVAVLGVILAATFLLPHLSRWLTRLGSVPMFSLFTGFGAGLVLLIVALIGIVPLSAYGLKVTGHPKFCASCHNMDEYYVSWEHSSHKDVSCVACHAEPGVAGTMAAKAQGMVQLVEYLSGSYGTKPHGEISSASCQQIGCHADVGQDDEVILLYDKIRFRHDKHLSEHPGGKSLNCVSCHGQTVEGVHMSVSQTTCLTCHFYMRGDNEVAQGDCLTCHNLPEEPVTFVDEPFSHKDFINEDRDVTCVHCHSEVTQGDGMVSRVRCMACHLETHGEIEDQEAFHLTHVSEGHFDCLNCHEEIKHGDRPMADQLLTSTNCSTCHGDKRHAVQEKIYAGTAIAGMEPMPDVMYEAGVACDGCHDDAQVVQMGTVTLTSRISGVKQCVHCHGDEDYADQLNEWQETVKEMVGELEPMVQELEAAIASSQASDESLTEARRLATSARMKLDTVIKDGSHGAHNVGYVIEILDSILEEADTGQSLLE